MATAESSTAEQSAAEPATEGAADTTTIRELSTDEVRIVCTAASPRDRMLRLRPVSRDFYNEVSALGIMELEVCSTIVELEDHRTIEKPLRDFARRPLGPAGTPRILWLTPGYPTGPERIVAINEWDWTLPLAWLRPRRVVMIGINTTIEISGGADDDGDDLENMVDYWPSLENMTSVYDFTSTPEGHAGQMLTEIRSTAMDDEEYANAMVHSVLLSHNSHVHELALVGFDDWGGGAHMRRRVSGHFPNLRRLSLWDVGDEEADDFVNDFVGLLTPLRMNSFCLNAGFLCLGNGFAVSSEKCALLFNVLPHIEEFGTLSYLDPTFWHALREPISMRRLKLHFSEPEHADLSALSDGITSKMPSLQRLELSFDNMFDWRSEVLMEVLSRLKSCPSLLRVVLTGHPDRPDGVFDPRSLARRLAPVQLEIQGISKDPTLPNNHKRQSTIVTDVIDVANEQSGSQAPAASQSAESQGIA